MTVMRWKWEDEEAEESESNGICRPRIHLCMCACVYVCVLAEIIYVGRRSVRKASKRTSKNVCPAETPSTTYKRQSASERVLDRHRRERETVVSFSFSSRRERKERKEEENERQMSSASTHSFLSGRKKREDEERTNDTATIITLRTRTYPCREYVCVQNDKHSFSSFSLSSSC